MSNYVVICSLALLEGSNSIPHAIQVEADDLRLAGKLGLAQYIEYILQPYDRNNSGDTPQVHYVIDIEDGGSVHAISVPVLFEEVEIPTVILEKQWHVPMGDYDDRTN